MKVPDNLPYVVYVRLKLSSKKELLFRYQDKCCYIDDSRYLECVLSALWTKNKIVKTILKFKENVREQRKLNNYKPLRKSII